MIHAAYSDAVVARWERTGPLWLRPSLNCSVRISYWIAPRRRIIMLTVFTETKMRETAKIERAKQTMARCQREAHTVSEDEEG